MKLEERKLYNQVLKAYLKDFDKYIGIKKTKKEIKIVSHTVKKGIKRKMSAIKKVVISLNILSLLFLFACGEDNITNNTGNPPVNNDSLVISIDSIIARSVSVLTQTVDSNVTLQLNTGDSVKISFTLESNCDTTHRPNASFVLGNISKSYFTNDLNNSYTLYGVYSTAWLSFHLEMHAVNVFDLFLKFKDIKVYKVNPV